MICRFLKISGEQEWLASTTWLSSRNKPDSDIEKSVAEIISAVEKRGDSALLDFTREFDAPDFNLPLAVTEKEIGLGAASIPIENREQISAAAANIRAFHEAQVEKSWFVTRPDGTILGQRVLPVDSVGLYVPGGKGGNTPLLSSLLMNAIPAQVAGVSHLAICTPPRADGSVNPYILAAAHLLDIEMVFRVGGAWSIAALAIGTESIGKVDVVAGPGNIYVTTAKRLLQGRVGIDMIAGPSEVLVLADSGANPVFVAADMLAQAEHDTLASAICVTDDIVLGEAVSLELEKQLETLPRKEIAGKSLRDWGCIAVVPSLSVAIAIANIVAPEHLGVCTREPWSILPHIRHAGAVFLGQNSPEPMGDYFAGPNHVLPTLGTARFSSALSVQTFCKKTSIISASRSFLKQSAGSVAALSRLEGLEGHARSVEKRLGKKH